jgi:hypothetical protein
MVFARGFVLLAALGFGLTEALTYYCVKDQDPPGGVFYHGTRLSVCDNKLSYTFQTVECSRTTQGKAVFLPLVRKTDWTGYPDGLPNHVIVEELINCEQIMYRPGFYSFTLLDALALCPYNVGLSYFQSSSFNQTLSSYYAGSDQFCAATKLKPCSLTEATCYCVYQKIRSIEYDEWIGSQDPLTRTKTNNVTIGSYYSQLDQKPLFPLEEDLSGTVQSQFTGRIIKITNTRTKRNADLRCWLFADGRPFLVAITDGEISVPNDVIAQEIYLSITVVGGSKFHHHNRFKNISFDYADVSVKVPEGSVQVPGTKIIVEQTDAGLVAAASVLFGILVLLLLPVNWSCCSKSARRLAKVSTLLLAVQGVAGCSEPLVIVSDKIDSCIGNAKRVCGAKVNAEVKLKNPGWQACLTARAKVTDQSTLTVREIQIPIDIKITWLKLETIHVLEKMYETRSWKPETETVRSCFDLVGSKDTVACSKNWFDSSPNPAETFAINGRDNANYFEGGSNQFTRTELFGKNGYKVLTALLPGQGNCGPIIGECFFGRLAIVPERDTYSVLRPVSTEYLVYLNYEVSWNNVTETGSVSGLLKKEVTVGDKIRVALTFSDRSSPLGEVSFDNQRVVQKISDPREAYILSSDNVARAGTPEKDLIGDIQTNISSNWDTFKGFSYARMFSGFANEGTIISWKGVPTKSGLDFTLGRGESVARKVPASVGGKQWSVDPDKPSQIYSHDPDGSVATVTVSIKTNDQGFVTFEEQINSVKPAGRFLELRGNVGACLNGAEIIIQAWSELDDGPAIVTLGSDGNPDGITLTTNFIILKNTLERTNSTIKFRSATTEKKLSFSLVLTGEEYNTTIKVEGELTECIPNLDQNGRNSTKGPSSEGKGSGNSIWEDILAFLKQGLAWIIPVGIIILFLLIGLPLLLCLVPGLVGSIGSIGSSLLPKAKKN